MFRCLFVQVKHLSRYSRYFKVVVSLTAIILVTVFMVVFDISNSETKGWMTYRGQFAANYVQPEKFTTLTVVKDLCTPTKVPAVLIIVCSSVDNYEQRSVIRETWAAETTKYNVSVYFLVGRSSYEEWNHQVFQESVSYGDIIVEDFIDTYYNLTLKSIMLLKWVKQNCPNSRFVLKMDDDVYFNIKNLIRIIDKEKIQPKNLFLGKMYRKAEPDRRISSKWYVPEDIYPHPFYPPFLCGVGFLMSGDVVLRLFEESFKHELYFLEDVFLTGICAQSIGIERRNHFGFYFFEHAVDVECNSIHPHMILLSHYLSPRRMHSMHQKIAACTEN